MTMYSHVTTLRRGVYTRYSIHHGDQLKRCDEVKRRVQGSSPAAHDKGEHEPYSSEEEADRPTPIPRTRSISNYRPLYSIYIPNSDRPSEVVLIPTNAAAGVQRSSSLPTNPDALLEEGEHFLIHTCLWPLMHDLPSQEGPLNTFELHSAVPADNPACLVRYCLGSGRKFALQNSKGRLPQEQGKPAVHVVTFCVVTKQTFLSMCEAASSQLTTI